jgi:hypothetical protein
VILAAIGAALIGWVMFVSFVRVVELTGFAALIGATVWDRRVKGCAPDSAMDGHAV